MNYTAMAKVFPLQEELIDAVIAFANSSLVDPKQVAQFFGGAWRIDASSLPQLSQCRRIQSEVQGWLAEIGDAPAWGAFKPMTHVGPWEKIIQKLLPPPVAALRDIRFVGALGCESASTVGGARQQVAWCWWVENASLRAICGLAVATILQAELHDRVGLCARDGCGKFFVAKKSRGIPRKYCKSEDCDRALNRERVAASRGVQK